MLRTENKEESMNKVIFAEVKKSGKGRRKVHCNVSFTFEIEKGL